MNTVSEIEKALLLLPPQERWEIAHWLMEDLQENALGRKQNEGGESPTPLPDYTARRLRIFGDKVLPNMVLASRAEERF